MKYALERLDKLITHSLEPTLFDDEIIPDYQLEKWIEIACNEKENIRIYLQRMATHAAKKKALELRIRGLESSIKRLQRRVHGYKINTSRDALEKMYVAVESLLEELVQHIDRQYYSYLTKQTDNTELPPETANGGLILDMTVEEIGLLHKVMKLSGVLLNKNVTKLMEDVSRMVHTKNTHQVSATSLYNSYYTVHEETIRSLSDKLLLMLNHLRRITNTK